MSLASEELSERIRSNMPPALTCSEKKMFGGNCFMWRGNMLVAATKDGSMLARVGKEGFEDALALPGATLMSMGTKTMAGFVQVSGDAIDDDDALAAWIDRSRAFVATLPPK